MLTLTKVDIRAGNLREIESKLMELGHRWLGNTPDESIYVSDPNAANDVCFLYFDEDGRLSYCDDDEDFFLSSYLHYDTLSFDNLMEYIGNDSHSDAPHEEYNDWIPSRERLIKYFMNLPKLRG